MKISVIIVSYNTCKLLEICLKSLFDKNKNLQLEVIVVDNDSIDESCSMVKNKFKQVKLIENNENLGFSVANNQAIKIATGDYLLLLNSDTIFVEDSLEKMISYMNQNPKIGISSCQLIYENGDVQPSGGFFPNLWRIFNWMFFIDDLPFIDKYIQPYHPHASRFNKKDNWYNFQHFQDWVTGAFFLIRKKVVEEIGGLDENFFMYAEEMEFCYRAKQKGWRVSYYPDTKIIHLGGKSGTSKNALIGEIKGIKYFYQKHQNIWQQRLLSLLIKMGSFLRMFIFGIIMRRKESYEIYWEILRIA